MAVREDIHGDSSEHGDNQQLENEWESITAWTHPQPPNVELVKIPGKEFGLVASRDIKKGEVVFGERAPLGSTIVMPTQEGTTTSHCTGCFQCMEAPGA